MLTSKELHTLQAALTTQISRYNDTYKALGTDREKYIGLQRECLMIYVKLDWELFDRFKVKSRHFTELDLIDSSILRDTKLGREK
jgi:hypothetical protein